MQCCNCSALHRRYHHHHHHHSQRHHHHHRRRHRASASLAECARTGVCVGANAIVCECFTRGSMTRRAHSLRMRRPVCVCISAWRGLHVQPLRRECASRSQHQPGRCTCTTPRHIKYVNVWWFWLNSTANIPLAYRPGDMRAYFCTDHPLRLFPLFLFFALFLSLSVVSLSLPAGAPAKITGTGRMRRKERCTGYCTEKSGVGDRSGFWNSFCNSLYIYILYFFLRIGEVGDRGS